MSNVHWGANGPIAEGVVPSLMLIGDSWFWYPVDNLARELGDALPEHHLVVVGNNGSEAQEWDEKYRKSIDQAFRLFAPGVQALLLSGGGNDVAGMKDFPKLLRPNCSQATQVADCYAPGQPAALMCTLEGAYRRLISRFRNHNTTAPVFMHNYDYAWPTGKGLFGPADWLREPMQAAQVPVDLRRELFRDLIERLRQTQLQLRKDKSLGPLVAISTAGTLPDDPSQVQSWWANELHPTPAGFERIAKKAMLPTLRKVLKA